MKIGEREIGFHKPPYVIAEAGANHNGSIDLAFKLVEKAKESGADCVKFQTYKTELFCEDKEKLFEYKSQGKSIIQSEFEMFKALEFGIEEWVQIIKCCEENKIDFMTTIQDPIVLDEMLPLGITAIKVGSDDFDHVLNLEYYMKSGLPLILSKGMADVDETNLVIDLLRRYNYSHNTCLLHCVSLYPCDPESINLYSIRDLRRVFPDFTWGFSDHTISPLTPSLSVMEGASVIEKHFTLDNNLPGPDHWFSVDPSSLKTLVDSVSYSFKARGLGLATKPNDLHRKVEMRRRIIFDKDKKKGDFIKKEDLRFRRASNGMFPSQIYEVIGKKVNRDINNGEFLEESMINN